ncbi:outer membrane beta-barrel protein [Ferruginibacter sp. HRS2-29]|uniref:outer membrane beta-barrel protein n=1 Tax=Ferruginibacter sp. HRS2-29 TaxID=2487334 RepID=UPI0020CFB6A5|nr:outer membrane beta-barrel protein [Ferruginibacter sp. HRS2-29]MCP9750990.1 porin family protein [Ferruginibacter sp. HRS2-29]
MKEKQFDHIENKIRAAAENSEPDFDEQSWQKMEQLLDKDDDRKRPLTWFILPVLLCALVAGYFVFNKKDNAQKEPTLAETKIEKLSSGEKTKTEIAGPEKNEPIKNTAVAITGKNTTDAVTRYPDQKDPARSNSLSSNRIISKRKRNNDVLISDEIVDASNHKRTTKGKTKVTIRPSVPVENEDGDVVVPSAESNSKKIAVPIGPSALAVATTDTANKLQKKILVTDTASKNATASTTPGNKKSRASSRFYFTAAAGFEASSVKFLSASGSTAVGKYGLGAGYQLSKRWAVQTGFNVSRKKYIAGAGDYNAKEGSYWSMVEIKKVDANCLVYEIPLTIRYDVLQRNKFNLYATAGISSFIMKKEDYQYDYIRNNTFYQRSWTYTGNKNLFSVVSVSMGVETKLRNGFSLLAEPSVSVPVSGVGDGKVKLYSMGLQVGLKYQPFKKQKK